ncbi:baseplate J/gp47 family protein [Paenibacillus validus]|uniref:baseplate J/gp47 family protein n=1 Tax=Paenibacillus validus TaxID=44253 RepID=UPI000FD73531|nr:baseplate J/gp47 family protein [Paenibacillus validus]MED4599863.1 baseplate J/gp47 family protein [Paenibacillus validus]MED4606104.1 baseplate J/gp47 family protein [Paenibacillus validus]
MTILEDMLSAVSDDHDKRPGSFIYDALAPAAEQFSKTDDAISAVQDKLSIDNLSGDELAQRVKERTGIDRKAATRAKGSVTVTGTGTINTGDLFETSGGVQFRATESKSITSSGTVSVEAVITGAGGIVAANTIKLFPITLAGFTAVTNSAPTYDGFDAESDADLLARYYEIIRTPATSGNKAHYVNWSKEVAGVGLAKVFPLWNGNNTVKVVIINSDRLPASVQLVSDVQDHLDPGVTGLGDGAAPIGAFVTVTSATGVTINVAATIALSAGYTQPQAIDNITASLTKYLQEIAFVESIVSYAKVGAAILDSAGVEDYSGLTVNGGTANVSIGAEQVAVLGTVTINVA